MVNISQIPAPIIDAGLRKLYEDLFGMKKGDELFGTTGPIVDGLAGGTIDIRQIATAIIEGGKAHEINLINAKIDQLKGFTPDQLHQIRLVVDGAANALIADVEAKIGGAK